MLESRFEALLDSKLPDSVGEKYLQVRDRTRNLFPLIKKFWTHQEADSPLFDLSVAQYEKWEVGGWTYEGMRHKTSKQVQGPLLKYKNNCYNHSTIHLHCHAYHTIQSHWVAFEQ